MQQDGLLLAECHHAATAGARCGSCRAAPPPLAGLSGDTEQPVFLRFQQPWQRFVIIANRCHTRSIVCHHVATHFRTATAYRSAVWMASSMPLASAMPRPARSNVVSPTGRPSINHGILPWRRVFAWNKGKAAWSSGRREVHQLPSQVRDGLFRR